MFNFPRGDRLDEEYRVLCAQEYYMPRDTRVQSAARLLSIERQRDEADEVTVELLAKEIASIAEVYKVGPDVMQIVLNALEPIREIEQ